MKNVLVLVLVLVCVDALAEDKRKTVAVLEYRAGAKGGIGIGDRLAHLLASQSALTVIEPQEARRRRTRIDAEVAKCGGEAMCIGTLGEQLGADEVLLVGVSQLGDVVLSFQRIDAKKGEAGARMAESIPPDVEPSDYELLGWLHQLFPPDAFRRYGAIRIVTDVPQATVMLNGADSGHTPLPEPLKVRAPAAYRVRVVKSGFVPFQARIDVVPDATVEVRATLVRESGPTPWFKRWYVWAIVGGAAAAAGAGLAIYYGTRVEETPQGFIVTPPR